MSISKEENCTILSEQKSNYLNLYKEDSSCNILISSIILVVEETIIVDMAAHFVQEKIRKQACN